MKEYIRKVKYYETDKMSITHHSNYVRWMEEARMDLLDQLGCGMKQLEEHGITSPVVSIACQYKQTTTFDDEIRITTVIDSYTGARLSFRYEMVNTATNVTVFTGTSSHCFIDTTGRPLALKKHWPQADALLKAAVGEQQEPR